MAFIETWNSGFEGSPAGSDNSDFGATEMRGLKIAWRERFEVSHDMETLNANQGLHKHSIETITSSGGISQKDIVKVVTSVADITITFPTVASCRTSGLVHPFLVIHSYSTSKAYLVTCAAQSGETFDLSGTASYALGGIGQAAIFIPQDSANVWTVLKLTPDKDFIVMWSGLIADIPYGWALCDGDNNTPDLRGKFMVGYNATDADYDAIAKEGGEEKHALTTNELPSHTHEYYRHTTGGATSGSTVFSSRTGSDVTGSTGSGTPHENRPPYYALAYIMKL
jgi:hypothetical protein